MKRGIRKTGVQQKFFTITNIAERWQLSLSTIRRMIDRGELKTTRFGNSVRISLEEVQRHETDSQQIVSSKKVG